MRSPVRGYRCGKPMVIYDRKESCLVSGEFRSVRELDSGVQLGYFEGAEYANRLAIMVLYPNGNYFIAEQLDGVLAPDGR